MGSRYVVANRKDEWGIQKSIWERVGVGAIIRYLVSNFGEVYIYIYISVIMFVKSFDAEKRSRDFVIYLFLLFF